MPRRRTLDLQRGRLSMLLKALRAHRGRAAMASLVGLAAVLVAALIPHAVEAHATGPRLITWTVHSRYVNVGEAQFSRPPPGDTRTAAALRIDVLLPAGYDGERRFPMLYLLHGHGDTYQSWMNRQRGDVPDVAKGFPAIVVMPEAAQGWYTNWWDGGARGADGRAWEDYFLHEVIPMVESRLMVLPGRSNHAIAGLSMGGEGAMYFAAALPGYFGSAASFSGVLSLQRPEWPSGFATQGQQYAAVYGDPKAQDFYSTGHNPTALTVNLRNTRVFVRVGDGVALPATGSELSNVGGAIAETELSLHAQDFVASARQAGVDTTYQPETGIHDWPWWRTALRAALQWGFFQPMVERPTNWTYRTVATTGQAWDLAFSFAAPPSSVATLTRHGTLLVGTGSGTVRITPTGRPAFTVTLPFEHRLS